MNNVATILHLSLNINWKQKQRKVEKKLDKNHKKCLILIKCITQTSSKTAMLIINMKVKISLFKTDQHEKHDKTTN